MYSLDFDKDADEFAQWSIPMPDDYNGGTFTATFYWLCNGGGAAETVEWNIEAHSYGDNEAIDVAWGGTPRAVSDTWQADDAMHISSATAAVTAGGTPAGGEFMQFRVWRDVSDDDLGTDARLHSVKIIYTRS